MHPVQGLGDPAVSQSSDPRRPGTSRVESTRPGTSFGQSHHQGNQGQLRQYGDHYGADQFDYPPQYGPGGQYEIVEEGYEEESEDEDVFAFLPPSTADAAKEAESSTSVGGPAPNMAPEATAPQNQVYYY